MQLASATPANRQLYAFFCAEYVRDNSVAVLLHDAAQRGSVETTRAARNGDACDFRVAEKRRTSKRTSFMRRRIV
jgi:hypothetical protein